LFDKNSPFGRLNIWEKQLCVKKIAAKIAARILCLFVGFSAEIWGIFGVELEKGVLSAIGRGPSGGFEDHRGTPVPPTPLCLSKIQAIDCCYIGGKFETQKSCEIQTICAIRQGN
jgi:hypothetical protein